MGFGTCVQGDVVCLLVCREPLIAFWVCVHLPQSTAESELWPGSRRDKLAANRAWVRRFWGSKIRLSPRVRAQKLDAQTPDPGDPQTLSRADAQIFGPSDTPMLRHSDTQTLRHAGTQTLRRADAQTLRHADAHTLSWSSDLIIFGAPSVPGSAGMIGVLVLNQGHRISPRLHPRSSGVIGALVLISGAPQQSSEFRGYRRSDFLNQGRPIIRRLHPVLGVQG